ncbi:7-deoxyloganetic acid glucosyltransferase-like [Impatiens glandulifera]|uniref:7-deoxyloganetic acid glucosyltransferase-like n=1 Tax=Impatiens glandulifera TaxID=253017 RepID=UPI001FB08CE1|nr:7-deoxyloganetic acid glucosyltransferase-like [Impatiens glandulifera]
MDKGNPQEEEAFSSSSSQSHVLIFPFPLQGHVNSMLKLAELLCFAGINVTFLVSENVHSRLLLHSDVHRRLSLHPGAFQFKIYSDGLPQEDPRSGHEFLAHLLICLKTTIKDFFLDNYALGPLGLPTCIISDGVMNFVLDVGEEKGIPVIYFRTIGASSFWCYFCLPQLIDSGEIPFQGTDMDLPIQNVTGMEGFLRRRDLPSICRSDLNNNPTLQGIMKETLQTRRAWGLILNTFEDLEGPALLQIRTQIPNVYTIGPLHAHSKIRLAETIEMKKDVVSSTSNSLWKEDRSCISWLDSKPNNSVIYVSFGSLSILTREQLVEFWHGLVSSGKCFLWVIRPESIVDGDGGVPIELEEGTKERGYIVGWAPQEEVLGHPAVGGFLTHSGWNSTLESIDHGLPMICWPYFLDQQVNSRLVESLWELGLDMKDICDRLVVKRMIDELMDGRRDEFKMRAKHFAKLSHKAITSGGSSYSNLDRLIEDIRSMAHKRI